MESKINLGTTEETKEFQGVRYTNYTRIADFAIDTYIGVMMNGFGKRFEVSCGGNLIETSADKYVEFAVYGIVPTPDQLTRMADYVQGWIACEKFYQAEVVKELNDEVKKYRSELYGEDEEETE